MKLPIQGYYPNSVDNTSCSASAAILGHWCPVAYTFAATYTVVDLLLILRCSYYITIILGPNLINPIKTFLSRQKTRKQI